MSDIEEHRKKIEEITLEMIKLLKTRTDIAKQIGDAKANLGMTVTDEEREDALRTQVTKLCKEIDLDQLLNRWLGTVPIGPYLTYLVFGKIPQFNCNPKVFCSP